MALVFSNFGKATVASAPSGTSGLSFSVTAGQGSLFPNLGAGDYFYGIFKDSSGNREIVKITARSTDAMTIAARGLDGTAARTWNAGDYFVAGLTNAALQEVFNPNLSAIGGLVSAADKMPYFTGSGTAALAGLSAFIRTLLDDADAATARATLGAAPSASPALTGTPTSPTAATGTNTTQIATTAFVLAQIKNVPLFNAYAASSQSVTSGVAAKVTLGTKVRDTDSCFASSRFTAATAGDYFFRGSVRGLSTTLTSIEAYLYKNGSPYRVVNQVFPSQSSSRQVEVSDTIYLGVGDWVELWAIVIGGTPSFEYISSYATSSLCGYLVRPA